MSKSKIVDSEKGEKQVTMMNLLQLNELFPSIASAKCLSSKPKKASGDDFGVGVKRNVSTLRFEPSAFSSPVPCEKKAKVIMSDKAINNEDIGYVAECANDDNVNSRKLNKSREENIDDTNRHVTTLSFDPSLKTCKRFICQVCGNVLGSQSLLDIHQQVHVNTGSKSPVSNSNWKSDVESNLKAEPEPQAPFKCPECHKTFIAKSYLKSHSTVHTGEKPYHCSHCGKRFRVMSNFYKHVRRMHE